MSVIYDKHFDEAYAGLTLAQCFHIPFDAIGFLDKPDLQIAAMDLGIEVTQAISQYEGMCRAMANRSTDSGYKMECMRYGRKQSIKKHYQKRSFRALFGKRRRLTYLSPYEAPCDCQLRFQIMRQRILQDKLPKLNKEYTRFQSNALYLFTYTGLIQGSELKAFFASLAQDLASYPLTFDAYYINCVSRIYLYVCQSGKILEAALFPEQLAAIKKEAVVLAQKRRAQKKPASVQTADPII